MPRTARIVIPGIAHHVTQRGNRRQQTFFEPADYARYIELIAEAHRICTVGNTFERGAAIRDVEVDVATDY